MPNHSTHSFTVGTYDCTVVSDGTFAYPHPGQLFFANALDAARTQALRDYGLTPADWDEYRSPYPSLVIETDDRTVLIDTGAGDLAPTTGKLRSNLDAVGIAPEDVDTVVLTHGHPDHIGGCVNDEGTPAFPDASYVISDTEWEFWTSTPDLSPLDVDQEIKTLLRERPQETLPAVEEQVELVSADTTTELAPGIRTHPAPGHTPGHLAVSVVSSDDRLLHVVDAVLHPLHLSHPEWYSALDYDPDRTIETRRRLLTDAATDDPLVLAYHFPSPGLGHVTATDDAWEWAPI